MIIGKHSNAHLDDLKAFFFEALGKQYCVLITSDPDGRAALDRTVTAHRETSQVC